MNTDDLILQISEQAVKPRLRKPPVYALAVLAILGTYGAGVQMVLGLRPDLLTQLGRPFYAMEILLLAGLGLSSAFGAIMSMYPDRAVDRMWMNVPFVLFFALLVFLLLQLFLPTDPRMVFPDMPFDAGTHCTLTITGASLLPSALMFGLIRRGASVHPWRAGAYAVLTAFAIGCLTLRLAEANDSISHMLVWHYAPTLVFAFIGAVLGRYLLRW